MSQTNYSNLPDLIPCSDGGKWGFCDINKNTVIDYIYDFAYPFSEGLACVFIEGKFTFVIHDDGRKILDFDQKYINENVDKLTAGDVLKGKWIFIDKAGNNMLLCLYDEVEPFKNGLAKVKTSLDKIGFIDKTGNEVIPCIYEYHNEDFTNGFLLCMNNDILEEPLWGILDNLGQVILPFEYKWISSEISQGLYKVRKRISRNLSTLGFINEKGDEAIPCIYDDIGEFDNGMAIVSRNKKQGIINIEGNEIIPCLYEQVQTPTEGLIAIKLNGKWGFADYFGHEIIACIYDIVEPFSNGLALVEKDVRWRTTYVSGQLFWDLLTEYGEETHLFRTIESSKKGFIDKEGNKVIPCIYDEAYSFKGGLAKACRNGKWGLFVKIGKEIHFLEDI